MGVVYDLFVAIGNMCSANIFMICLIRCLIYGRCNQMPIKSDQVNYRNNCRFILSTRWSSNDDGKFRGQHLCTFPGYISLCKCKRLYLSSSHQHIFLITKRQRVTVWRERAIGISLVHHLLPLQMTSSREHGFFLLSSSTVWLNLTEHKRGYRSS